MDLAFDLVFDLAFLLCHPERSEWTSRFAGITTNLNKKKKTLSS
jgi:hypothetical protein